ncbi:MAG: hypothetical protein IK149_01765 [Oscillospiraceae bacterium]|nr:hypothetical protein [Oscillospiraceae bacterium]
MKNYLVINVNGVDMTGMTDIQFTIKQPTKGLEFTYSGDAIDTSEQGKVIVTIPKSDAAQLAAAEARGQLMFTWPTGIPDATKTFTVPIEELLKGEGYGE